MNLTKIFFLDIIKKAFLAQTIKKSLPYNFTIRSDCFFTLERLQMKNIWNTTIGQKSIQKSVLIKTREPQL